MLLQNRPRRGRKMLSNNGPNLAQKNNRNYDRSVAAKNELADLRKKGGSGYAH